MSVVLLTGCSSSVALHAATKLAQNGFTVFATVRDVKQRRALEAAKAAAEVEIAILTLEGLSKKAFQTVVKQVINNAGQIDILINVQDTSPRPESELSNEELEQRRDTGFFCVLNSTTVVLPYMRDAGHGHISIVSTSRLTPPPDLADQMNSYLQGFFGIKITYTDAAGRVDTDEVAAELISGIVEAGTAA